MANDFVTQSARANALLLQRESEPNVLDGNSALFYVVDMNTDANGFEEMERFSQHQPDGFNSPYGVAMVGSEGQVNGNHMPHYESLPFWFDCLGTRTETTLPDGRIKSVWKLPETGAREMVRTFGGRWGGLSGKVIELLGGFLTQIGIEATAGGEMGGNLGTHFNRVRRGADALTLTTANETQTLATGAGYAGGNVQIGARNGGAAQNIIPGTDDLAAIRTKIALAINKPGADLTVIGTSSTSTGVANPPIAPTPIATGNPWTGDPGSYQVAYSYITSSGETQLSPFYLAVLPNGGGGADVYNYYGSGSLPDGVVGVNFYIGPPNGGVSVLRLWGTVSSGPFTAPTTFPSSNAPLAPTANTTGSTSASLALTIEYSGASVSGAPQPLLTSTTAGVTIARVTAGGDGKLRTNAGPYLETTHVLCYKASDLADLNSVDMGTATTRAPLTDPHLIKTAQGNRWSWDNLAEPVSFENRDIYAEGIAEGAGIPEASITLPKDDNGRCEEIYATENRIDVSNPDPSNDACGVTPWYFRQAYRCGSRELWIDMYCARNAQPSFPVANNVSQRQFPLIRHYNSDGSLYLTIIRPASSV